MCVRTGSDLTLSTLSMGGGGGGGWQLRSDIYLKTQTPLGRLGGSVGWAPDFSQVTISWSVSSSPASGSGLMAQSLEPASDSVSSSLSAPPPFMLCLSLSQK